MKKIISSFLFVLSITTAFVACSQESKQLVQTPKKALSAEALSQLETAYFASGCFWCVEAVFESVEGVGEVYSGYSGGEIKNPTYRQVARGLTKHAEAVEVFYDPEKVSYETLVKVFFGSHDPTTLNRQGPDRGPQYRSAIFYKNEKEKAIVDAYIKTLVADKVFKKPITTEIAPLKIFYKAEEYHQDYERLNPRNPYVMSVSIPRLKKFQAKFPELLKESAVVH